jgi:dTDP-4-dehydrorhamnose reductase
MRIVLTGVTGQVGRALLGPLGRFADVIPADRSVLNLAKPEELSRELDRIAPDLIINPAAYTAVDRAEDERELAFSVNADAPSVIARFAARRGVPLVHFSTDYVFDGGGEASWQEDSRTSPLSVYGASKLAGEEAIRAAGGSHLIVRVSWVYAAQGTNFLNTMVRLARERSELRVVADQVGAPTSARVIADVISRLLESDPGDIPRLFAQANGILNIATSGETSWYGFANRIVDGLRKRSCRLSVRSIVPLRSDEYPTRAQRPRNSRLSLVRLREAFDVVTPFWHEALEVELDQLVRDQDSLLSN